MKKFRFSLESVLTLRSFRKKQASGQLAQARRSREEKEEILRRQQGELVTAERVVEEALSGSVKASRMVFLQNALGQRREAVAASREQLSAAAHEEETAREALLQAQREEEALLKLKERQRERALREMEKEDEKAMEEFVAARLMLREET